MFRVIDCIAENHDLRLVLLAVSLCLFACCTTFGLFARARAATNRNRVLWVAGAGFVAGCGIWATHFVAMLAYQAGFLIDYDISLTVLSILIAVALCTAGFALALVPGCSAPGGALAGAAVGIMHYVGMAALRVPAREIWDLRFVAVSLAIGIAAMAFGMRLAVEGRSLTRYLAGVLIFTLAICTMHFTGMAAVRFVYDPLLAAPSGVLNPAAIAVAVAAVAVLILGTGMVLAIVDHHRAVRAVRDAARLRRYIVELEATKAELERSLQDRAIALANAAAANKAKSAFLAAMSHELRTPLNAIIGFSEMMTVQAFGPIGDARYKDYAHDIHDSGRHLLALINDILDLSRLDAGKADLYEETLQIAPLIADCLRMMEPQARAAGLTLLEDVPADLPRVLGDERRLKQVLINLLGNAMKFTASGGRVTVTARQTAQGLAIAVADTGIGIAPEDIATAFETFGQVDSSITREHPGTGLGLPLARKLMELHDGSLVLESTPDVGTTVTALLPVARVLARSRSSAA